MKLFSSMLHALKRSTSKQSPAALHITEAVHLAGERTGKNTVPIPKQSEQHVTMRLAYASEDERYLEVRIEGKTIKIAKSRAHYILDGGEVLVTMTKKYAASRPELAGQQ